MIVSSRAYAAGSLSQDICVDPTNRPQTLTLQYVGGSFVKSACEDDRGPNNGTIEFYAPFAGPAPACVVVYDDIVSGSGNSGQTSNGTTVNLFSSFTVPTGSGGSELTLSFADCNDPNTILGRANMHVSCSQALCVGDKYGYFLITGAS